MKKQGVINKRAYSVYFDSPEAENGSILFDAIDKAKYSGELMSLSLAYLDARNQKTTVRSQIISYLNSLSYNGVTYTDGTYPVRFITAESASVVGSFSRHYVTMYSEFGYLIFNCGALQKNFEFNFDGNIINIPITNFYRKLQNKNNGGPLLVNGREQCTLNINPNFDNSFILGTNFLKSVYLYVDLDNQEISVAPVAYTTETDIQVAF